jgi:hypothetical protein
LENNVPRYLHNGAHFNKTLKIYRGLSYLPSFHESLA